MQNHGDIAAMEDVHPEDATHGNHITNDDVHVLFSDEI
jgi:hypothetical protein